jgi:hypothetical protein
VRVRALRGIFFAAALIVFLLFASVALAHDPRGIFIERHAVSA